MNHIYFVRHGENVANLTKEFSYKKVDYSLTPKGRLQAAQTAEYFVGKNIHAIFASPLKRAVETAAVIAQRLGLPYTTLENFREVNVGALEDLPPTAANWETHNRIISAWFQGRFETTFPGGENYYSLVQRAQAGLRQILAGQEGRNLIVVAHGGIINFSLPELVPGLSLQQVRSTPSNNCSITELVFDNPNGRLQAELVAWGQCAHLSGEAAQFVSAVPEQTPSSNL